MNRREILIAALGGGSATLFPLKQSEASVANGDDQLTTLAGQISRSSLLASPQAATSQGVDVGAYANLRYRLDDRTAQALSENLAATKTAIKSVEAIDPSTLSPPMALKREIFLYWKRAQAVGPERFRVNDPQSPFVITHRNGAYFSIPGFLDKTHKITNKEDAEAYLERTQAFAKALDQDTERQASDARRGYLAPDFILDTTITQIASIRAQSTAENLLTRSIAQRTAKTIPGDWAARCAAILEKEVYPALDRQLFMIRKLREGARQSAGIWDIPEGDALYASALEGATTTKSGPAKLYELGQSSIASIQGELDYLLRLEGLTFGSVGQRLRALSKRSGLIYPDTEAGRAEIVRDAHSLVIAMRKNMPNAFDDPPDLPLQIEPAPAEVEDGASTGSYFRGSWNGSVPARVRLNLKALVGTPRYALPALIYHEGIPGHHLQYSYGRSSGIWRFTAYSEGWAVYSEQLADELNGYSNSLERIGYLQSRLYRAARLVVDTGIHSLRWTRAKAVDYLASTTGLSLSQAQREIDRYCVNPGQACSYMVGYKVWTDARDGARRHLGGEFKLKNFHKVLMHGAVPLYILERLIREDLVGDKYEKSY